MGTWAMDTTRTSGLSGNGSPLKERSHERHRRRKMAACGGAPPGTGAPPADRPVLRGRDRGGAGARRRHVVHRVRRGIQVHRMGGGGGRSRRTARTRGATAGRSDRRSGQREHRAARRAGAPHAGAGTAARRRRCTSRSRRHTGRSCMCRTTAARCGSHWTCVGRRGESCNTTTGRRRVNERAPGRDGLAHRHLACRAE